MPVRRIPPPARAKEAPPSRDEILGNLDRTGSNETETLTFRVAPEFKREFKAYAASQGMSMVTLLKKGYDLARAQEGS